VQKANAGGDGAAPESKQSETGFPPSSQRNAWLGMLGRQFSRFLAVGVATTAVHYGVLIALVEAWDVHPVLGTTAGFVAAVFLSYLLNRRYTFDARPTFGPGLLKYYASVSMGLVINAGLMAQLTAWGLHYLPAQVVASGAALVWNFLAARFLVFRG
jgi:putative flippase GtrA